MCRLTITTKLINEEVYVLNKQETFFAIIKNFIDGTIVTINKTKIVVEKTNKIYQLTGAENEMSMSLETIKHFSDYFVISEEHSYFLSTIKDKYYPLGRRELAKEKDRNIVINFLKNNFSTVTNESIKRTKTLRGLFRFVKDIYERDALGKV